MAEKRIKRPSDPWQLAKMIGDIATGQIDDKSTKPRKSKKKKSTLKLKK